MEYCIVSGTTTKILVQSVYKLIELGWKPIGGVSQMKTTAVTEKYIQAMIKDE